MTRMTSKGQVTIPKEIRDKLGIGPGSEVGFHEEGGQTVIVNEGVLTNVPEGKVRWDRFQETLSQLRREGKIKPLGMTVDAYMDMIRGYSEDADDPGFKRTP
jgi:AbrB family looped-hinge helix DNA binding protein